MAVILKTMPGRVTARGRKMGPKAQKARTGSSRRGMGGKSSRRKAGSKRSGSSRKKKGRKKKGKRGKAKAASAEEYANVLDMLQRGDKARELLNIKLMAMTQSRQQYRKCAFSLLDENEAIQNRLIKVEKECIEVVGFLHQKRSAHEMRLEVVEKELAEVREVEESKRQKAVTTYETKIKGLRDTIEYRNNTIENLKYEVKKLKELKDTNIKLEENNEALNKELLDTMVRHQNQLVEYEAMILREKRNLEKLAKEEVHNLVDTAHEMAAKNVGATTADIYNTNCCLNVTLQKYRHEVSALEKTGAQHQQRAHQADLRASVAMAALRQLRNELAVLQRSAGQLQERLAKSEEERDQEAVSLQEIRAELRDWAAQEREQDQRQLKQLRRQLAVREATICRLRQLARRILARRSQLEDFFLSALDHVSGEAAAERRQYWKDAGREYRDRVAAGVSGDAPPPDVMTLDGSRTSSHDISDGWRKHNKWSSDVEQVDVTALTWPQKESVLRLLFAQINGLMGKAKKQKKARAPRKKTADVGVQKFAHQKRKFTGRTIGGYPVLSPYMDKSIQIVGV